jgi:hypothetical protein
VPGRELPPTSPFAGDDGSADPALADALARYAAAGDAPDRADRLADVVATLARARVLVPVLAVEEPGGTDAPAGPAVPSALAAGALAPEDACFAEQRHAAAGIVAVAAPDGRTALPVFTCVAALAAWHPTARPMPAEAPRAAAAAVGEGWDVLVVDPGGPVTAVVPRPAVHALATGGAWVPAVRDGQVRPGVRAAVGRVLAGVPHLHAADAVPGRRAEVAVVLALPPGLTRAAVDAVLADVSARLAADAEVTAAVDSFELRLVSADAGAARG